MKYIILVTVGAVLGVLVLLIAGLYVFTRQSIYPSAVMVESIEVTPQTITFKNVSQSNSGMWYAGYKKTYTDGVLTVVLYAHGPIRFPGDQYDGFSIEIPNSYGDIREIRIGGGPQGTEKTVWQK